MDNQTQLAFAPRDLLDFDGGALYFDTPPGEAVAQWLEQASTATNVQDRAYALAQAERLAPDDLTVIVALYRHFYFEQAFEQALRIADRAMGQAARALNIPPDWTNLSHREIAQLSDEAMPLLRFYLWALKGRAYLLMRQGQFEAAIVPLEKLVELDHANRLNCEPLLALAREQLQQEGKTNEK